MSSIESWPGVRTFHSPGFRIALASVLLVIGIALVVSLLARQAADPEGQYGVDMAVNQRAARDVAAGISPYPPRFQEAPIAAQDMAHKYSPASAQAFVPLGSLPTQVATTIWGIIQAAVAYAGVWMAASYGGARRTIERALWSGVAVAYFLPIFDSIWKGNLSAVQGFAVALVLGGGGVAGVSLLAGILLKTTPAALLPAVVARGGAVLRAFLVASVVVVGASILVSPQAWLDFVRIQPNLFTGDSLHETNLMPANMILVAMPDERLLAQGVRLLTLGAGVAAVAVSVRLARRERGWAAAVMLGVCGMLLIPAAAWYHYLAVLLPMAAYAWPKAGPRHRGALVLGAALIAVGLAWFPLILIGAAVLMASSLVAVWPRVGAGQVHPKLA